jgi:Glycosyltransferase family 87
MPTGARTIGWCCAGLMLVRIVAVGVALDGHATMGHRTVLPGDVRRYHRIAGHRGTPYADFAVEYPPLTLAAIDTLDGGTVRDATVRVMWSQLALDGLVALLLAWGWGRRAALAYLVLGLAFAWYPFLYLRLDLLSVALAVGGLALIRRRRPAVGGATLALACFAKVWPLALVPVLVARRSWRALGVYVGVVVTGAVAWVGWAGITGPVQVLTFRGATGWQVESTIGAFVHVFATGEARIQRGAARIGVVPDVLRLGLPLLGLAVAAGVGWLLWRVPRSAASTVDGVAPVAALSALLVCATLLSPQYVSWLLPFAAIAVAGGERIIGWLTALVALLSTLGLNLVKEVIHGEPLAMAVVLARNAALLLLLAVAITRLIRLARVVTVPAAVELRSFRGAVVAPGDPPPDLLGSADGRPDDRRTGARA